MAKKLLRNFRCQVLGKRKTHPSLKPQNPAGSFSFFGTFQKKESTFKNLKY